MSNAHQAYLDHHARMAGFPDYQTWVAWQAHQVKGTQGAPAPAPPVNFMQMLSRIPIHPATIIQHVADRFAQATGQQQ